MNQIFIPLTQRIVNFFHANVTPNSEEERERNELKKAYYYFIYSLIDHKLANVLRSSCSHHTLSHSLNTQYTNLTLTLILILILLFSRSLILNLNVYFLHELF
jgi:hypothetical protein